MFNESQRDVGMKYLKESMNDIIKQFIDNVVCRYPSNQQKAKKLWIDIKPFLNTKDASLFETEWNHYVNFEFDVELFCRHDIPKIKKLLTK